MEPEAVLPSWIVEARKRLEQAYVYYEQTERSPQVLAECDAAIAIDPGLAEAHNLRGIALEELERPEEAMFAYRQALKLDPGLTEAQANLATMADACLEDATELYQAEREPELALKLCLVALEIDPDCVEGHNLHAVILEQLHRPAEALAAYRRAAELDPYNEGVAENLAGLEDELASLVAPGQLVTIARVSHPATGDVLKSKLQAVGIEAVLLDHDIVGQVWTWGQVVGGVRLVVRRKDLDAALDALGIRAEWETLEAEYFGEMDDQPEDVADSTEVVGEADGQEEPEPNQGWELAEQALAELTAEALAVPPEDDPIAVEAAGAPPPSPCPECGSQDVRYEPYSMRLAFLTLLLIKFPVPFRRGKWRCQRCGSDWKP
jgi:tetratricopeptide (TPR) repeat protein